MRKDSGFSYIGRLPCGCVVAAVVDSGDKFTRQSVNEFMRDGLTIERVPHDYVREHLVVYCPHQANQLELPLNNKD